MDETGVALGKYLSSIRETAGLTQAELAKKVTVSPARISRIESGDTSLTADEMDQLLVATRTGAAKELRPYLAATPKTNGRRETMHTAIFEIRFTTSERTGGRQSLNFEKIDHCHEWLT
jgi:transcriptional regulator with XRE-family HTH domain